MDKYEYEVTYGSKMPNVTTDIINNMAVKGWEFMQSVHVQNADYRLEHIQLYFRRKIKTIESEQKRKRKHKKG